MVARIHTGSLLASCLLANRPRQTWLVQDLKGHPELEIWWTIARQDGELHQRGLNKAKRWSDCHGSCWRPSQAGELPRKPRDSLMEGSRHRKRASSAVRCRGSTETHMNHHLQTIAHCARSLLLSLRKTAAKQSSGRAANMSSRSLVDARVGMMNVGDGSAGSSAPSSDTLRPPRTSCNLWTASAEDASSVSSETGGFSASFDELEALSSSSAYSDDFCTLLLLI